MSESQIIEYASPTLAGIKTANLFMCRFECQAELLNEMRLFNSAMKSKGIRMIPLKINRSNALIYLYRPHKLKQDFCDEFALEILKKWGYDTKNTDRCIKQLIERFQCSSDFPHEIGLFLGYPPEDVKGFIENKGEGCKCVGCWKVYGDVGYAKKKFANYKKCTKIYLEQFSKGKPIEKLCVAQNRLH